MAGCPGHSRHWFTRYGSVGDGTETCQRCGATKAAATKRYLKTAAREWAALRFVRLLASYSCAEHDGCKSGNLADMCGPCEASHWLRRIGATGPNV